MSRYCPNCQRPVLPSDQQCWQCGAVLPSPVVVETVASTASAPRSAPTFLEPLPAGEPILAPDTAVPPPILVYSLLTVGLLLGLIWLLPQLAAPPLLQATWADYPPEGWVAHTAVDYLFTLNLPADWQISAEAVLPELVEGVTRPWANLQSASAWQPIFYAAPADNNSHFVLILQNSDPNRLSPEETLNALTALPAESGVNQLGLISNGNRSYVGLNSAVDGLRCRQGYVHGRETSLLIATCGQGTSYGQNLRTLTPIFDSFEFLRQ
jgi:hypothetical protein